MIKVFIAGATGWAGSELSKGVFSHKGMKLVGALSRKHQGGDLADVLHPGNENIPIFEHMDTALSEINFDVLVDPETSEQDALTMSCGTSFSLACAGIRTEKLY